MRIAHTCVLLTDQTPDKRYNLSKLDTVIVARVARMVVPFLYIYGKHKKHIQSLVIPFIHSARSSRQSFLCIDFIASFSIVHSTTRRVIQFNIIKCCAINATRPRLTHHHGPAELARCATQIKVCAYAMSLPVDPTYKHNKKYDRNHNVIYV